jgi:hypothetical protein
VRPRDEVHPRYTWPIASLNSLLTESRQSFLLLIQMESRESFSRDLIATGLALKLYERHLCSYILVAEQKSLASDAARELEFAFWRHLPDPGDGRGPGPSKQAFGLVESGDLEALAFNAVAGCLGDKQLVVAVDPNSLVGTRVRTQLEATIREICDYGK